MKPQRIDAIEVKTREIIGNYLGDPATVNLPIDVASILEKLKIQLYQAYFDDITISGAFDRKDSAIYLSNLDSKTRQLFTVAHELGHYFLQKNKETDIFYRHQLSEFNGTQSLDEQEANWFAASLLMPKEHVERIWREERDEKLLAAYFGVSPIAAHWRLKNLKLI